MFSLPRPVFDSNPQGAAFGNLPEWDLTDLYQSPDAPALAQDMAPSKPTTRASWPP